MTLPVNAAAVVVATEAAGGGGGGGGGGGLNNGLNSPSQQFRSEKLKNFSSAFDVGSKGSNKVSFATTTHPWRLVRKARLFLN